ncbi:MAG TPA: hypothetical protein VE172_18960 [Stackebrandtia sp.]|jgi:hypothetical protein|uniref:hypothetical protein n=1 Tax=Stackebrandtia sp. TaxID=2023065 RepID=UPI002D46849E|nr:hypothetical protein [Stackebrandtia sp.]HZE40884.1 hypothetical protein [Stackebrandtia sp.]
MISHSDAAIKRRYRYDRITVALVVTPLVLAVVVRVVAAWGGDADRHIAPPMGPLPSATPSDTIVDDTTVGCSFAVPKGFTTDPNARGGGQTTVLSESVSPSIAMTITAIPDGPKFSDRTSDAGLERLADKLTGHVYGDSKVVDGNHDARVTWAEGYPKKLNLHSVEVLVFHDKEIIQILTEPTGFDGYPHSQQLQKAADTATRSVVSTMEFT